MKKTTATVLILSATFLLSCVVAKGSDPVSSAAGNVSASSEQNDRSMGESISTFVSSTTSSSTSSSSSTISSVTSSNGGTTNTESKAGEKLYGLVGSISELDLTKPVLIASFNNNEEPVLMTAKAPTQSYYIDPSITEMTEDGYVFATADAAMWTVMKSGNYYTFQTGSSYLQSKLSKSGSKSYYNIGVGTDSSYSNNWSLSFDEDGLATMKSDVGVYLEYFESSKGKSFQGYKSPAQVYLLQETGETGERGSGSTDVDQPEADDTPTDGTWTWDTDYKAENASVSGQIDKNISYYELDQNTNSVGTSKILVLPIAFTDKTFTSSELQDIKDVLGGSAEDTKYWESLASYYQKSSYGKLNLEFTYADPVDMGVTAKSFYSGNGQKGSDIALEKGVAAYKKAHGDASTQQFDQNNDGLIDSVIMIYACDQLSNGDEEGDLYWAYRYWDTNLQESAISETSPVGYSYFWASMNFFYEGTGTRASHTGVDAHTMTHEFGHMLGADDYYNADQQGLEPSGSKVMMAYNVLDHDAFNKMAFGWINPTVVSGSAEVTLTSSATTPSALLLADKDGWNGSAFDEYVLVELYTPEGLNQQDSETPYPGRTKNFGNDTGLTQAGIRMWHVDNRFAEITGQTSNGGMRGTVIPDANIKDGSWVSKNPGEQGYYPYVSNSTSYDFSAIQGKGMDSLTMISAQGKTWNSDSYAKNNDLFHAGDSFSLMDSADQAKYKKYFAGNAKMNNGKTFPWKVTVKSIENGKAVLDVAYGEMK